jgi:hypothetical protein
LRGLLQWRVLRAVLPVCAAALTAQCAVVDNIDGRIMQTNRSSEMARNESTLLNILRASNDAPLNFVAFARVTGITTVGMGAGLPSFLTGPYPIPANTAANGTRDATIGSTTLSGTSLATNSYDLTVLESKEFYEALLSPIDLPIVNYFIRQGYPHELIFWLFVDSVRETTHGSTHEYQNIPDLPPQVVGGMTYTFRDMIKLAIATGLSIESKAVEVSTGSGTSGGAKSGKGQTAVGTVSVTSDSGGGANNKATKTEVFARVCFDQVLVDRYRKYFGNDPEFQQIYAEHLQPMPRCYSAWTPQKSSDSNSGTQNDTLKFTLNSPTYGRVDYQIFTRSTLGVYRYLGQILREGKVEEMLTFGRPTDPDRRILALNRNSIIGKCFTEVSYDGVHFCVPDKGTSNTKQTFAMLAQLVALKTQTNDLAITPVVRLAQ